MVIEKFKKDEMDTMDDVIMWGQKWVSSIDKTIAVRKLDFPIEEVLKKCAELSDLDEIPNFVKVKIIKFDKEQFYILKEDTYYGFRGALLSRVVRSFGEQSVLYIPEGPVPGYAIIAANTGEYIVVIAPIITEHLKEYVTGVLFERETQRSLYEDDGIW